MIGNASLKEGVVVVLTTTAALFIIEVMLRVFAEIGEECVLTSGAEGVHSPGSLHPKALAIDFRGKHLTDKQRNEVIEDASVMLGKDYDVVSSSHGAIHIEYDPKE